LRHCPTTIDAMNSKQSETPNKSRLRTAREDEATSDHHVTRALTPAAGLGR
jgi:hypothetical protein